MLTSGELLGKFVRKRDVVGLQLVGAVGLGVREDNLAEGLSGGREGAVVDASDARTEGCGVAMQVCGVSNRNGRRKTRRFLEEG